MTKKYITKILSITLILCMLFTTMSFAAPKEKDISATTNPELIVYINGCKQYLIDGQGNPISPILYNNTNYLPARFVIETLGAHLNYDAKSLTISVTSNTGYSAGSSTSQGNSHSISESSGISSGNSATQSQTSGSSTNVYPKNIKIKTNPSLKLIVDGENKKMMDGQGKEITAINYNNTNYLPMRFLANSLNFYLTYVPEWETVFLDSYNIVPKAKK